MKNNDRKNQLIKAAFKRFSKLGYHKTTLEEVARDIRISKATIYHYFNSKDELYLAVLDWDLNDLFNSIQSILSNEDLDLLDRFVKYFEFKNYILAEDRIINSLIENKIIDRLKEKEIEILDKLFINEVEIINSVVSSNNKNNQDKFGKQRIKELVYLSWVTAIVNKKFSKNESGDILNNQMRIKSLVKIFIF